MKTSRQFIVAAFTALFLAAGMAGASENLIGNGGFEAGEKARAEGWSVWINGDRTGYGKVPTPVASIINISPDARTGKRALVIDTTGLNPSGKITDELRTWKCPKYEILVTQDVHGIEPNSWYLVKFRIKSPGIAVTEGMQLLADIKPWPLPIVRLESFGDFHWGRQMIEGRLFLPQAPKTDGEYHEYVILKQTYHQTDTLKIGLQIRAPWTGRILIDDVELMQVDPEKDLTKVERLLALRSAKPIKKVRELNPETTLVKGGEVVGAILIPSSESYKPLGAKIRARISELTDADLPVVTKLADVPEGRNIVAVGNMMNNELVARLYFNRYVKINAHSPGPGGYVIWTVAEPYGLAKKQNVIVVAGSDAAGETAAVDAFCDLLTEQVKEKTIELPFLHTVFPQRKLKPEEKTVPRKSWRMGGYYSGFSKWFLPKWLNTGDLEAARLARKEMLRGVEHYLNNPYTHEMWAGYEVALAWDCLEEAPVFSDEDRLKITNFLLAYLHIRPRITSDWSFMVPHLNKNTPTWNHQAKGLAGVYMMGRYFKRFYGDQDGRYDYYLGAAHNVFRQQAQWSKPEENSENYTRLTIRFALAYYLGEWDMTFFENGAMRRVAEYFATVCTNKGWTSGFGDTYYCYVGWRGGAYGFEEFAVPLALWYYKDGRMLWWLQHVVSDYQSPYHQDIEPVEWKELVGVKKTPLEKALYDPRSRLPLWGADGEGAQQPVGDIKYEETFDKIAFRENWHPEGQYMLVEGIGRGIHSGHATNQICKLSLLGEDLLIGSTYIGTHVRSNDTVIVVKDKDIDDPAVKGKARGKAWWQQAKWKPLGWQYPAYAALDTMADLPSSGFTRTSMRDFLGGTDWHRNIFWLKGKYFAMIDEVVAKEAGTYYIESNLRTCPKKTGRWPTIIPRTGKILEDDRGFEVTISTPEKTRQYILTDGTARIITNNAPARDIDTVMVRQVHPSRKLNAGQKVTYINLFYADREGDRKGYRLERISPTEGLIFEGRQCVGYFGCGQSDKTRAILPIEARMFLLTPNWLAVVDGTSAGEYFKSKEAASTEIEIPAATLADMLKKLSNLIE